MYITPWAGGPNGNLTQVADWTGTTTRDFDPRNLLTTVREPDGRRLTSVYDGARQRVEAIDPDGVVTTYAYDAAGRLNRVENPYGETTTLIHDAAGRKTADWLSNGTRTSTIHDAAGRTRAIWQRDHAGTAFASFSYTYDPAGNRTSVVELSGDRVTWAYDQTNQLLEEDRSGSPAYRHTFSYDPAGNRQTLDDGLAITTYSYDAANRLEWSDDGVDRTTYTYDAAGNRRSVESPSGDVTTYAYDLDNQLVQVEDAGGAVTTYVYNALQQRVGRDVDGDLTQFLWDGVNLRQESQTGVIEADYTVAPQPEPQPYGDLVSQRREMESSFYHFDALGSARALTDDSPAVTDESTYKAFGETAAASGTTANPFGWVAKSGYYRDEETGLIHLDRRKHDPPTGAFTTEDPRGFEAGDSNFYRYVGNNPITKIDPSGLEEPSSPPRGVRELAGAIQRRDAAQLYVLYAAWKRGILYGVFVDGGWGTLKSIPEMAWEAVEWNQWLREAQYAALTDPLGFAQRRREELERARTVVDQVRKLTPDELRRLMTGDTSGLEGKVDETLLEISGALGEALNDLQRHLTEELSAEDAAYAMGRIYGAVAFEVTLTVGTGGAAAALKAGKLARIVGRLRKIRGLNTPTGERLLKRLTDAADAVHDSVRKSARGETLGSGPGGLGDLGTGKRAGAERGGAPGSGKQQQIPQQVPQQQAKSRGHETLAERRLLSPMDERLEASKPSLRGATGETHIYNNPGHHDPNGGLIPYNPSKSVIPGNHVELFENAVPYRNPNDGSITYYARDAKGEIHRFQADGGGREFHWNGQTNGRTKSGTPVRDIVVPTEIKDFFKEAK